ncbi:hypothetical protein [Pseudonocardia broussonetiae]|uniref:Uncharacterized protein n=1 Tax=Pseudonocardia broussonetiae TaxID=2736640 RepID=A0A6M6JKR2_9PSEU|nr:hypothetical protein [Pseudonocardia broussonetiae]QJY47825.1 hypothetical protein HOP40_20065 [Pseudonocardia broussonetiae]
MTYLTGERASVTQRAVGQRVTGGAVDEQIQRQPGRVVGGVGPRTDPADAADAEPAAQQLPGLGAGSRRSPPLLGEEVGHPGDSDGAELLRTDDVRSDEEGDPDGQLHAQGGHLPQARPRRAGEAGRDDTACQN